MIFKSIGQSVEYQCLTPCETASDTSKQV